MNLTPTVPITPELAALAIELERSNVRHALRREHPEFSMAVVDYFADPPLATMADVDYIAVPPLATSGELFCYWLDVYGQPI